jgi:DNA-directed RNA polymerase subunit E'/Rpb7
MVALFVPIKFKTQIYLKPKELDERFEEHILYKLQQQYEGLCSRHGFIKPGSIQIIERTLGQLVKAHFNGHVRFELTVMAEVCNPIEGMVVSATVKNKNQMGILAESVVHIENQWIPVLDIIIPKRTAGISSEIPLDNLMVGDMIQVEVLGKRYNLNDKKISIIGRGVESERSVATRRNADISLDDPVEDDGINWEDDGPMDETETEAESAGEEETPSRPVMLPGVIEEAEKSPFDEESDAEYENEDYEDDEDDYAGGGSDDFEDAD